MLSDTRHTEGKNISVLGEPRVPCLSPHLPRGQSRGEEIQADLFPGFKQNYRYPFSSSTQPPSSHSIFLVVGRQSTLEARQEGTLRWQRGLRWRSPACLPAPAKGLSPPSKACPETLWSRRLIFHAERDEIPTVTSFTSQCW